MLDCSGDDPAGVDEAALLAALRGRGLRRILTEGGPMLLGSFIQRDLLDELCLTIAPYVVGGLARRIATGPGQVQTRCAARVLKRRRRISLRALRQSLTPPIATVVGMRRHITYPAILIAVSTVVAGCVPGLAADPRFATNRGARPQGQVINKPPPAGPPRSRRRRTTWHGTTARRGYSPTPGCPRRPG